MKGLIPALTAIAILLLMAVAPVYVITYFNECTYLVVYGVQNINGKTGFGNSFVIMNKITEKNIRQIEEDVKEKKNLKSVVIMNIIKINK